MESFGSYDTFGLYILTPVWCVCLTVIVGFYGRIFLLVRAHGRKIFDKGSLPPPDKKKEDKKQKQEETKNIIKNETENTQTIDPNEKEPSGENIQQYLHPTSEELPTTTVTDYLNINEPEIVTEKSMNELPNETPQVLEGIVEPNDHQVTSPSSNEEVGAVESSKVTDGEVSEGSNNGEEGDEDTDHRDTSETSPSTNEDGTVKTSAPQDITETSPASGNGEDAEEQSSPQETAAETSPASTGETTAAPQEEEEEVVGAVCMMPSLAQRERGNAKKESKLAKRSGYIIFTFLIFWMPLIATVVLNHFYYRDGNLTVS